MTMPGIEQVLSQVISALQTNMTAKVAALNGEYADAYVLTVPATASYLTTFDKPTALQLTRQAGGYPAVIIEPQPETVEGDSDLSDGYVISHGVQVSFIVRSIDPVAQQKLLMRYMRAAKEILGQQAIIAAGDAFYEGGGFATQYTIGKNDVLRDIVLLFRFRTLQRCT